VDVFEQEHFWKEILYTPHVGVESRGAWVVEALGVTAYPVAGLGERLAGRAADKRVNVTLAQTRGVKNPLARNVVNVIADDGPCPVRLDGLAAIGVKIDCDSRLEACSLKAVVETASPGVEADYSKLTPPAVPRFPDRTPPQSSCGSQRK